MSVEAARSLLEGRAGGTEELGTRRRQKSERAVVGVELGRDTAGVANSSSRRKRTVLHLGSEGEKAIHRKSQLKIRMPVCA